VVIECTPANAGPLERLAATNGPACRVGARRSAPSEGSAAFSNLQHPRSSRPAFE